MKYRHGSKVVLALMVAASVGGLGSRTQVSTAAAQAEDDNCVVGVAITGNGFANTLTGGVNNDIIQGLAGNDDLRGAGCNDRLAGGAGNDELRGGPGNDELRGGPGFDQCNGGGQAGDTFFSCEVIIP